MKTSERVTTSLRDTYATPITTNNPTNAPPPIPGRHFAIDVTSESHDESPKRRLFCGFSPTPMDIPLPIRTAFLHAFVRTAGLDARGKIFFFMTLGRTGPTRPHTPPLPGDCQPSKQNYCLETLKKLIESLKEATHLLIPSPSSTTFKVNLARCDPHRCCA